MASLSDVFKAYDIRGVVPDQLNAEQFRAIGVAVARFAGATTLLVARDMRESGVELSAGLRRRRPLRGGRGRSTSGLASTDLLYFAAGSLDAPGAMFTASHNPARYNGLKLCLSGARPIGRDTGLAEIQATAEALLDELGSRRRPRPTDADRLAPIEERVRPRRLRRPRPLLRRRRRPAPAAGRGRHGQRHGRPGRPQGRSRACPSRSRSSSASSTGTSPTTRPTPSSRRTWSP